MKKQILDHGYIELVESWGSDERVIESARMSTGKGFLRWGPNDEDHSCGRGGKPLSSSDQCAACHQGPGDEKLLRFLWENKHATPFEMAGLTVEVQAPIFVFREWHRHRTQSYNEMSARYEPLPDVNYVPAIDRLMLNSKTNKQAGVVKGAEDLTEEMAGVFQFAIMEMYRQQEAIYQAGLKAGVPKELARVHLAVGRYSRMRAHTCLRNWLAFLTLRKDKNAQWEIRQYANALGDIIEDRFPRTWELFSLSHTGRWDDDGPEYFEHQIALHEKKLEQLKKDYEACRR